MALTDDMKGVAKGTFASSALALIGAAIVYFIIKAWQKARS